MDKQLLKALENIGNGLELLVDSLNSKKEPKSEISKSLKSGDFGKSLEKINAGILSIKKDTKEILKRQQTILEISKKKNSDKKTEALEGDDPKKQNSIKKGVATILLIAVAVLAIGLAFKIVGKIDFLSVVGLSIAIVLVAIAFERVSKLNLGLKQAAITSLVMIIMSAAITISSWVLKQIKPISFGQAITGILIIGMFAIAASGISKIMTSLGTLKLGAIFKNILFIPLILASISLGIALSSWGLSLIKPIGFGQAITAILISIVLVAVSFGLKRISEAMDSIRNPAKIALGMILILPAIALGIALSSLVLQLIMPISWQQALTAILISVMFTVLAFGMEKIAKSVDKVDWKSMPKIPVFFTLISIAIAASAWILFASRKALDGLTFTTILKILFFGVAISIIAAIGAISSKIVSTVSWSSVPKMPVFFTLMSLAIAASAIILFNSKKYIDGLSFTMILKILFFGVTISLISIAMSVALIVSSKVGIGNAIKGGVVLIIIAAVIAAASLILNLGNYKNYPKLGWTIGVGSSLVAFGLTAIVLGLVMMADGGLSLLLGSVGILGISLTIAASSHILALGNYKKFPPLKWSLGVAAALMPFAIGMVALGSIILTGIGGVALVLGAVAILGIAQGIVEVSKILSKGNYKSGPSIGWAIGTGLLMTTFGLAVLTLGSFIIGSFGLGYLAIEVGSIAVKKIASSIVSVGYIFARSGLSWKKGPTKDWAEGVSIAIGAFAPVYKMLMKGGIMQAFNGSGPSAFEFAEAIKTISQGIIDAAWIFQGATVAFVGGPKKEWAEGVGKAIGAFAPVYKVLANEKGLFGTGVSIDKFKKAIVTISKGIIEAATIFGENKAKFDEGKYPSVEWGTGVGAALGAFAPVFKSLHEDTGWFTSGDKAISNMVNGVIRISRAIVMVAGIFSWSNVSWETYPTQKWSWNVKLAVESWVRLTKYATANIVALSRSDLAIKAATSMTNFANILYKGRKSFEMKIDPNFMKNMAKNMMDFQKLIWMIIKSDQMYDYLYGSMEKGEDPISRVAKRMTKLAKGYDALATSLIKLSVAMRMLNIKGLSNLAGIPNQIQPKGSIKSQREASEMVSQIRARSGSMVGKDSDGYSIYDKKKEKGMDPMLEKKNHIYYVSQQLEKAVKLLASIESSSKSIDAFLLQESGGASPTMES